MEKNRILLVEDDTNLAYLVSEMLEENDFRVHVCEGIEKARKKFKEESYDLCLLDIVLGDGDGIELAKSIRTTNTRVPIIFLTSRNLKSDKLLGYQVGADDYITKPFDPDILLAKIMAVIKRSYDEKPEPDSFKLGSVTLDNSSRNLLTENDRLHLSSTECGILKCLLRADQKAISRDDIMKEVWGKSDFFVSKSLDVYITRIRKILRDQTDLKLETIHGFGYCLTTVK